jgi:hypothetical protein
MAHYSRIDKIVIDVAPEAHDPASLLFCVIPDSTDRLNDENARRWD